MWSIQDKEGEEIVLNWKHMTPSEQAARLRKVKKEAVKAAKELFYPDIVFEKIENAKTPRDVDNIMINAMRYL